MNVAKAEKIKMIGPWSNPKVFLKVNQQPKGEKMKIEERIKQFAPNEEIEVINFSTMSKQCTWKCLKCGNGFEAIPNTIFHRHSKTICQRCNPPLREKEKNNRKQIVKEANKNKDIKLLDIYVQRHLRIKFQCLKCGQIDDFRWGDRKKIECTYCSGKRYNCNKESYQFLLNEKYDDKFKVLEFKSMTDKVLLKCQCGFCFTVLPISTLRARGIKCPKCKKSRSKGESFIESYLLKNKIFFESEKHFKWMADKTRYDFYIPDYNLIIEFHGQQHYEYTSYFYKNIEDWENAKQRDEQKKKLTLEHNINYLIIPYNFQNNLKEILNNLFGSTTISKESRAKLLEIQDFLNKEEDIV